MTKELEEIGEYELIGERINDKIPYRLVSIGNSKKIEMDSVQKYVDKITLLMEGDDNIKKTILNFER